MSKYKYVLIVGKGTYMASSLPKLLFEMFKHRCWHLYKDRKWVD